MIIIGMIFSNIIIYSTLVPHFHFLFHPPMSCFGLNHLFLWRLGRSWWLSLLAISRITCFHCLQDFSLIMACLSSQYYQRNIPFLSTSFVHLRWVTKGGSNHCHHHLKDVDVDISLIDMKGKVLKNSIALLMSMTLKIIRQKQ